MSERADDHNTDCLTVPELLLIILGQFCTWMILNHVNYMYRSECNFAM